MNFFHQLLTKEPKDRLGYGEEGLKRLKSHSWFQGLDWHELETKKAQSPYIPNNDSPNYDAVHELEELLCEEDPLRPHPKSKVPNMQELLEIDNKFLPYDHTKQQKKLNLIRKMGEKIDQAKYNAQGYQELNTRQ